MSLNSGKAVCVGEGVDMGGNGTNQAKNGAWRSVGPCLRKPRIDRLESGPVRDIVDHDDAVGGAVEALRECFEFLLAGL